jgi:hypothetical protein
MSCKTRIGLWTAKEMRECFEKWAVAEWGWDATDFGRSDDGAYIWPECDAAWDGWKGCYKRSGLDIYDRAALSQARAELAELKNAEKSQTSESLGTLCSKCGLPSLTLMNGVCLTCDPTAGGCLHGM